MGLLLFFWYLCSRSKKRTERDYDTALWELEEDFEYALWEMGYYD